MGRSCTCDSCVIGESWVARRDCRFCWLYWNDPRYRRAWAGEPAAAAVRKVHKSTGPGAELKEILRELGIKDFAGCSCEARAQQMNDWGVAGCRENFETIRSWIAEAMAAAGWGATIVAAIRLPGSGVLIDPRDVVGSLIRLAIRRAELKE